jgi:hypothetical protein
LILPSLEVCCLRYRLVSRERLWRDASGRLITDELIDVLARRAETGYEIEELTEPMDIAEAKARLDAVLDELAAAGFSVWGWDDETIQIGQRNGPGAEWAPRHVVDDRGPDS